MSKKSPILEGNDFKNQMWATGEASSIWPILSLLTFVAVTSTPHFSQITPLCFRLLYFPQRHSKSLIGPKIRAQKRPSLSGLNVL